MEVGRLRGSADAAWYSSAKFLRDVGRWCLRAHILQYTTLKKKSPQRNVHTYTFADTNGFPSLSAWAAIPPKKAPFHSCKKL